MQGKVFEWIMTVHLARKLCITCGFQSLNRVG